MNKVGWQPNLLLCAFAGAGAGAPLNALGMQLAAASGADNGGVGVDPAAASALHALPGAVAAGVVATVSAARHWADRDRSGEAGLAIHRHGAAILGSLPPGALLLAHSDLDWNPVRYLRACDGARPDVTHLSLQLMPYPWFGPAQGPLHPEVQRLFDAFEDGQKRTS